MTGQQLSKFCAQYGYTGSILHGPCGAALKTRLAHSISQFHTLEQIGTPIIPYIAAWREGDRHIWYEYAGKQLLDMLGCKATDVARAFRDSLITRCLYRKQGKPPAIIQVVRDRGQLEKIRDALRSMAKKGGAVEAVYKVVADGKEVWLKDLARIETYEEDGIILSSGTLIDVTKEMFLEQELKTARERLQFHQAHLEKVVDDRTRKLWRAQLEVVSRLARAAVCRDHKTGSHIQRMSRYCGILGRATGLKKEAAKLLYHAAPMHDVGKLGIADQVLLKPGKLTPAEYELMKGHCRLGADLLAGDSSDLLQVAKAIALTHHERWDGSGYPHGLGGYRIPLAGRIAALCDVFDALTSARPYKKAWDFDDAVTEIRRHRGIHFDPDLVDLFMEHLPKIRQIHTAH